MARLNGRTACYFWHSSSKDVRVSWVFPSRKEAEIWLNNRCFKYIDYGTLEMFLATVPASRQVKEREVWMRHRDMYNDLELRVGRIMYEK